MLFFDSVTYVAEKFLLNELRNKWITADSRNCSRSLYMLCITWLTGSLPLVLLWTALALSPM